MQDPNGVGKTAITEKLMFHKSRQKKLQTVLANKNNIFVIENCLFLEDFLKRLVRMLISVCVGITYSMHGPLHFNTRFRTCKKRDNFFLFFFYYCKLLGTVHLCFNTTKKGQTIVPDWYNRNLQYTRKYVKNNVFQWK